MKGNIEKKDNMSEEVFMVARRWDELDLAEKAKIEKERSAFPGVPDNLRTYVERLVKISRKRYLNED